MFLFGGRRVDGDKGLSLALGGGGARGFAHVGVLEVLHQRGAPIAAIAGTSAGALAGAGYALVQDPREMRKRVMEFTRSDLARDRHVQALVERVEEPFNLKGLARRLDRYICQGRMVKALFTESSVLNEDYFRRVIEFLLPEARIEKLAIPFTAVATDLLSGKPAFLDHGDLHQAVLASCSVPGVFPPVEIEGRLLVDGGAACLVPVSIALEKQGAVVVGVGVDREVKAEEAPSSALDAYLRAGDIMMARLGEIMLAQAQVAIRPQVGHIHWLDYRRAAEIMDAGREAAEKAWPQIDALCQRPSLAQRLLQRRGNGHD